MNGMTGIVSKVILPLVVGGGFLIFLMSQAQQGPGPGPSPPTCSQYTNQADCEAAGCYWWSDGTCHSSQEGEIEVQITDIYVNGGG